MIRWTQGSSHLPPFQLYGLERSDEEGNMCPDTAVPVVALYEFAFWNSEFTPSNQDKGLETRTGRGAGASGQQQANRADRSVGQRCLFFFVCLRFVKSVTNTQDRCEVC